MIKAGTIIEGPLDQAYEVTEDLHAYMHAAPSMFKAIGNAPEPVNGMQMPIWLFNYLFSHFASEANDRG